jgi:hypothetical protein
MEKILQEFRIIETDDGFRIEIKGDKEQLREFVMNLDPRRWMHGESEHGWGPFPFGPGGPRFKMRFKRGFGPFGFAWAWGDEDDDEPDLPRRKRGYGRHRGRHGWHGHHRAPDEDVDEIV